MARRRTTIYIDEDVLRAATAYAVRNDLRDSDVLETALRRFLGLDLFADVGDRNDDLSEEAATKLAYAEVAAARRGRAKRKAC